MDRYITITWQGLTTLLIVLAAVGYLLRYVVRWVRRKGMPVCGCCKKCPTETPEKPLINIDESKKD